MHGAVRRIVVSPDGLPVYLCRIPVPATGPCPPAPRVSAMTSPMRALVLSDSGMSREDLLSSFLSTEWDVRQVSARDEPDLARTLAGAVDAVVGGPLPGRVPAGARLQLYHAPFAGHDWIVPDDLPAGVPFCNTHEHETTIAEHVMAGLLEWQTGLMRDTHPRMLAHSFDGRSMHQGPHHRELLGTTVGIVGYGHIGREVARRCKAFGMTVLAISRTRRSEPDLVDWYGTVAELGHLLDRSDFIVTCAPGGPETRGMIGTEQFARMKGDAVIVNVGRGEVIDEAALYAALAARRIRGAVIDVWYRYPSRADPNPRPSRFPLHRLDNIIMSPHNSAWTVAMSERRWRFVAANLDRLSRGERLKNICFRGTRSD